MPRGRQAHPIEILASDAMETIARMRDDARHLKELGQRAKVAGKMAAAHAKRSIESGLERVADGILAFEREFGRPGRRE